MIRLYWTDTLDSLYEEWVGFADKTFGPQRELGKARHILKEAQELVNEIEANGLTEHAYVEMADILCILSHLSHDREHMIATWRGKIDKNYRREWKPANEDGIIEHVQGIEDDN